MPFAPPGGPRDPEIEPTSPEFPALQADSLPLSHICILLAQFFFFFFPEKVIRDNIFAYFLVMVVQASAYLSLSQVPR